VGDANCGEAGIIFPTNLKHPLEVEREFRAGCQGWGPFLEVRVHCYVVVYVIRLCDTFFYKDISNEGPERARMAERKIIFQPDNVYSFILGSDIKQFKATFFKGLSCLVQADGSFVSSLDKGIY
jgi:hypothetical protein